MSLSQQRPATTLRRLVVSRFTPVALIAVPFLFAAVRLASRHWMPVLDMAMTEIRVRDVFTSRTTLIGLPGRIGNFPDQGSHPGPLSFYLLAPLYKLLGSSGWALLAATCIVSVAVCAGILTIARRLGGALVQFGVLAVLLALINGFGLGVLTQPWNPYMPLLFWCLAVVAAWAVVAGDSALLVVVVGAASFCAQTHISYLTLSIGICGLTIGFVAYNAWRNHDADIRRRNLRHLLIAVGVGALLWSPVFLDQLLRTPGNLRMLKNHFTSPQEDTIGLRTGASLMVRHLDLFHFFTATGSGDITVAAEWPAGSVLLGLVLLVAWLASCLLAFRLCHRRLLALDVVIALALFLGWISASRIFGKIWFYLTLWGFVLGPMMLVAVVWTTAVVVRPRLNGTARTTMMRSIAGLLAVTVMFNFMSLVVRATDAQPPEHRLSESLRAVVSPTVGALLANTGGATGRDGRYSVRWQDAYFFGSQGYGLVNELERQGFEVGSPDTWRVPLTSYRVIDTADATAIVQFATGIYIERWQAIEGAVEVANVDLRTAEEVAEFNRLRTEVITELQQLGLDDLVEIVDYNLFGVQLDPRVPNGLQRKVNRMLELGQATAVFIVPPAAFVAQE